MKIFIEQSTKKGCSFVLSLSMYTCYFFFFFWNRKGKNSYKHTIKISFIFHHPIIQERLVTCELVEYFSSKTGVHWSEPIKKKDFMWRQQCSSYQEDELVMQMYCVERYTVPRDIVDDHKLTLANKGRWCHCGSYHARCGEKSDQY